MITRWIHRELDNRALIEADMVDEIIVRVIDSDIVMILGRSMRHSPILLTLLEEAIFRLSIKIDSTRSDIIRTSDAFGESADVRP